MYDARTGRLLIESNGFTSLALHLTPGEVQAFRAEPRPFDVETEYGRLRISNSVGTGGDRRTYLLQVGMSLAPMDAALARYRDLLLWRVPFALLAAVAALWWLSGFALSPLSRVALAAHEVNVQTRSPAARSRRRRRARSGVDAFNGTLARLEHAVERCARSVPRWRMSCAPSRASR